MARVFVSYRRADGVYGVGWIVERLKAITGDDVQAAFSDDQLRTGDDFPNVLVDEIERCDVVIAIIGRRWLGRSRDGPPRIQDGDDWIVRELSIALNKRKPVLPILIDGANPPLSSEIHHSIAKIASRNAAPLADRSDLDRIDTDIRYHLARPTRSGS